MFYDTLHIYLLANLSKAKISLDPQGLPSTSKFIHAYFLLRLMKFSTTMYQDD